MSEKPLRIGVVGVGFGAIVHIPSLQSEGVDVVAVCASREERAQEAAARFGIPNAFTHYDEMLRLGGVDAVSIASPIPLHHPMTLAALDAGKHVLCEKPFAVNQAQAKEMWQRARQSGKTAMIAHEFRFASGRMRVKELIDEGYLGPLQMVLMKLVMGPRDVRPVRSYVERRDEAAQGAGFLWGLGSHYIDCLRHWFGEITAVSGNVFTHYPERTVRGSNETRMADADDTFTFTLKFASGGWASMTSSNAAPFGSGATVEVYGRDGALITLQRGVNPQAHGTILGARLGEEKLLELPIPERLQPFADDRDDRLMPFRLMVREFLRGIKEETSPAPNFYDGYRCQQVLDAVRESSRTGREVAIPMESEG